MAWPAALREPLWCPVLQGFHLRAECLPGRAQGQWASCPTLSWTLDAQNNAGSDTNEPVFFAAGKRAGTEACSPVLGPVVAVHTCRTRWRVDGTLFPGHLHTCQPCTCPRACRAIPDVSHSHAWRPQCLWPPQICRRSVLVSLSVSFITRPAYWGSTALHRTKGLASAASSHLGGEDAVFRAQFIEGASVQAEQKC